MDSFVLPEKFHKWVYEDRREMVRGMGQGNVPPPEKMFLGFTRHNPVFISFGPAGLNGSVKGVGFVPKEEFLEEVTQTYLNHIEKGWRDGYSDEGLRVLTETIWSPENEHKIDFSLMGSLELAFKHSWENYQEIGEVTLLFFEPPAMSFEVRGEIEIHRDGPYQRFINAQHDVYHRPNMDRWPERPAYLIHIEEIYDNGLGEDAFGTRIL